MVAANGYDYRNETKRTKYERLRAQMANERATFLPSWRDQNDFILPRRARFLLSDVNKGDRRNQRIIDSTATLAVRTLRSGMMAGITSPARPWFRLTTDDPALAEDGEVKLWCNTTTERMVNYFLQSNLYNVLPTTYGDMGTFGMGCILVEEDFDNGIRFYSIPIGSYMVACDESGRIRVFFREFKMTVRQIVMKFAKKQPDGTYDTKNLSNYVQRQWNAGETEVWIDVCHVIKPNDEYSEDKLEAKYKKFSSCYYEQGSTANGTNPYWGDDQKDIYLRESGYDHFPVLCGRWEVTGEDVYATGCPGSDAIGDTKALQTMHKRKAQAIDKMVNPAMTAPTSMRQQKTSILPGDVTYVDVREGQQGFRPAHEVDPRIREMMEDIQDHQHRIRRAFYEDLFLMLAQSDRREITAREIEERHEEKLLALGPVLEQLNQDILDPLIDIAFDFMMAQGLIPEPPEALTRVGANKLKVEYVSIMAQAQKLVGIASLERLANFAGNLVKLTGEPDNARKINFDQLMDRYADRVGVEPDVIYDDEQVEERAAAKAKAQQQQAVAENMKNAAGAAKDLSQSSLEGDSALTRLLQRAQAGQMVEQ